VNVCTANDQETARTATTLIGSDEWLKSRGGGRGCVMDSSDGLMDGSHRVLWHNQHSKYSDLGPWPMLQSRLKPPPHTCVPRLEYHFGGGRKRFNKQEDLVCT
jgi:hypothetical protein